MYPGMYPGMYQDMYLGMYQGMYPGMYYNVSASDIYQYTPKKIVHQYVLARIE